MTASWTTLASAALAAAVTAVVLAALLRSRLAARWQDTPNARSLHQRAVPRVGGLAIAAGVAAALPIAWTDAPAPVRAAALGCALLAALSWIDDVRTLPALPRLAGHLLVAGGWAAGLGLDGWALAVALLAIGWGANLYNFMDGADGLAGGMAATGFAALAGGFVLAGEAGAATVAASLAGAALAFLGFNAPPARVFMGDAGSVPLGFAAAALGTYGWHAGAWTLAFPLIAFMPFWFDASVTLAWRVGRGERPWEAHRDHFYQKAVRAGLGHGGVARRAWALMAACAVLALVSRGASPAVQGLILFATSCVHATLALLVERRFRLPNLP